MNRLIIPILMLCIGFARTVKAESINLSIYNNVIYTISSSVEVGASEPLPIYMKNTDPIRGFQFRLYLPDGVTVVKNSKGKIQVSLTSERLGEDDDHTISASEQSDGSILVLCGSEYPENFIGNEGEIATVMVYVAKDINEGNYPIIVKNCKLSETDISKFYEVEVVESTLTILPKTTGIEDINKGKTFDEYYDLHGLRVKSPAKGVFIANGKKLIIK